MVAADGTVYFSNLTKIRKIQRNGKMRVVRVNEGGARTHALALAHDGTIWGDWSGTDPADGRRRVAIWRMLPDGSLTFRFGPSTGLPEGVGLLRDRRGCTWQAAAAAVRRKCPSRPAELLFGSANEPAPLAQASDSTGTALAADGSFLFRDGDKLRRISPDGKATVVASGLSRDPSGIAPGPDGAVFVAEADKRRVVSVAQGGGRRVVATSPRPWSPSGVAWRAGTLYLLEASDPSPAVQVRVRRIARDGAETILATVPAPAD